MPHLDSVTTPLDSIANMDSIANRSWAPSASLQRIRARAQLYQKVRSFFHDGGVLEVETPILANAFTLEPNISAVVASNELQDGLLGENCLGYLQSSPEFHMKRLLAAGVGDIYQITKAFRASEIGRQHNVEFSMLEWYRVDWTYVQLMQEVEQLLSGIFGGLKFTRTSYESLFRSFTDLNPHDVSTEELTRFLSANLNTFDFELNSKNDCFDLIFSHIIEPRIGVTAPVLVYDFPVCQSELAKTAYNDEGHEVALRFEVFFRGFELGNGYQELVQYDLFCERLEQQQDVLRKHGLNRSVDKLLMRALEEGLPNCSGVSLGLDRVLMLSEGLETISESLAFPFENA